MVSLWCFFTNEEDPTWAIAGITHQWKICCRTCYRKVRPFPTENLTTFVQMVVLRPSGQRKSSSGTVGENRREHTAHAVMEDKMPTWTTVSLFLLSALGLLFIPGPSV